MYAMIDLSKRRAIRVLSWLLRLLATTRILATRATNFQEIATIYTIYGRL